MKIIQLLVQLYLNERKKNQVSLLLTTIMLTRYGSIYHLKKVSELKVDASRVKLESFNKFLISTWEVSI